jgi:hypothetical protein
VSIPQPSPPGDLWKSAQRVAIQRRLVETLIAEQASRGYEYRSPTPLLCKQQRMTSVRASTAGCALFPKRTLRCRLVSRLYYKAFAETRSCLRYVKAK